MCIVVSISWETPGSYCLDDSRSSLCAVSKRVNEQAAQLTYRFCFLCVCTDGYLALEKEKNVRVPDESDIMKLRGDPETFKLFFVRKLLPCTVGRLKFRKNKAVHKLEKWATVSDEAFSLLAFENGWRRWKSLLDGDIETKETKYTLNGAKAKKGQGWSMEGLGRFEELYDFVKQDRIKHGQVDAELLEDFKKECMVAGTRRPKNPWGAAVNVDTNVQELRHDAIVASDAIIVGTAIGNGAVVGVGV